jgi:integrase
MHSIGAPEHIACFNSDITGQITGFPDGKVDIRDIAVVAYSTFLRMKGGKWDKPSYRQEEKIPFIPLENEVDQLISGCSVKVSCFLQTLKETAMRPGEAWRLLWTSIDFSNRTVTLNKPEKHSNPRQFRISFKLTNMLQNIKRIHQQPSDKVFNYASLASLRRTFEKQRSKIAYKTCNPRIKRIAFKTLRHWKASSEYQKTKDILWVQRLLGHKKLKNTLKYTHLVNTGVDSYVSRVAVTSKDICELVDKGFEYVCDHNGAKIFRKPK